MKFLLSDRNIIWVLIAISLAPCVGVLIAHLVSR
jgi:hypothetical protein